MNTDKYEGHTEGKWDWLYNDEVPVHLLVVPQDVIGIGVHPENNVSEADMKLIADAPLLLAEVKRLRDLHILACDYLQDISDGTLPDSEWPHIHAMIRGDEE